MPSCTPGINYATVNHLAAKSEKAGGIKLATTSGFQAPVLVRSEIGDPLRLAGWSRSLAE